MSSRRSAGLAFYRGYSRGAYRITGACADRLTAASGVSSTAGPQAGRCRELTFRARRGRPSNHRLPDEFRTLALSIVRERYSDFGLSLAAEKLAEHHPVCNARRLGAG